MSATFLAVEQNFAGDEYWEEYSWTLKAVVTEHILYQMQCNCINSLVHWSSVESINMMNVFWKSGLDIARGVKNDSVSKVFKRNSVYKHYIKILKFA